MLLLVGGVQALAPLAVGREALLVVQVTSLETRSTLESPLGKLLQVLPLLERLAVEVNSLPILQPAVVAEAEDKQASVVEPHKALRDS